ncbi:hypothetical protein [Nocardioides sp.]|uniref:hypothetical protein n=1 Tax=Nocardioides sp. TaxID=35761 RepID=UPI0039E6A237
MFEKRSGRRRQERGATTAEYIGISVVIVAIIGALVTVATPVRTGAANVVDRAYCRLASLVGGIGGCNSEDVPGYIPTKCTVSSHNQVNGGSVTVIATVTGDSGYTLTQVKTLNPDGTISTQYQVKTSGKVGANYTLSGGGGVEVNTGESEKNAKASLSINVGADGAWGSQYTFDTLDEANAFVNDYQDSFGEFGAAVGAGPDAPEADYTYFDISGQVTGSGDAGPLSGNVSGAVTLGAEQYPNGDTKVKLALTRSAAAQLGIPMPDEVTALAASGDAKVVVTATVTFDKNGQVTAIAGNVVGTVTGKVDIGLNTGAVKNLPISGNTTIKDLTLPVLGEGPEGGYQFDLGFSTDFTRADGSVDDSALTALSDGLANFITTGEGLTPEQAQAINDQLNNHSQITFNHYTVDKEETKYGGKVKVLWVNIGGEYHELTVDNSLIGSYYYDPTLGSWQENSVCDG